MKRFEDGSSVLNLKPRIAYPFAWVGHIPFVYHLVKLLRPRLFVELGTHSGNSYMAVCQAVRELKLETRCVAIDSWEGDTHSKAYGNQVLADLKAAHDPLYANFSTLLQKYFDDALPDFDARTIDLLHIDGLHTYDAVKHDFYSWLPKLSAQAVVILHDSAVVNNEFGVWKLVDELKKEYKVFEFTHSNGLAVVEVGADVPNSFSEFMNAAMENPEKVRSFFEVHASKIIDDDGMLQGNADIVPVPVSSKLYYRNAEEDFSEERSIQLDVELTRECENLRFQLSGRRPDFIRVDFSEMPGIYRIDSVSLISEDGIIYADALDGRVRSHNSFLLSRSGGGNAKIICFDNDPHVELDMQDLEPSNISGIELIVHYELVAREPLTWKMLREVGQAAETIMIGKRDLGHILHRLDCADARVGSLFEQLSALAHMTEENSEVCRSNSMKHTSIEMVLSHVQDDMKALKGFVEAKESTMLATMSSLSDGLEALAVQVIEAQSVSERRSQENSKSSMEKLSELTRIVSEQALLIQDMSKGRFAKMFDRYIKRIR